VVNEFTVENVDRRDPMDVGPEYRSVIGLSGGTKHSLYPSIKMLANKNGYKLQPGKGSDPDTLGTQKIYVYDSQDFPFYQAEIYHQFHVS
jgi:hypothetical protein